VLRNHKTDPQATNWLAEYRKLSKNHQCETCISVVTLIAGHQNTGRTLVTVLLVAVLAILLTTAFVALRKKTAPLKEPPLHPSALLVLSLRSAVQSRFRG
jgi:hypothetical protein